jgi:hypothetical protein
VTWQSPSIPRPTPSHEARRRRGVSVVVSVCVIIALVTISVVLVTDSGHRTRTLQLPQAFDNYTQATTLHGAQVQSMFSATAPFHGIGSGDLDAALIALYTDVSDGAPNVLFIGFTAGASPTLGAGLRAGPPDEVTARVLDGTSAVVTPQPVDAGPLGGAIRCAVVNLDGDDAAAGVWADADTLGIVLIAGVTPTRRSMLSTQQTASLTRDFRAAAEH